MNKKYRVVTYLVLFGSIAHAAPRINLYLENYPLSPDKVQRMANKMNQPRKITQYQLERLFEYQPKVGILATYAGYLDVSNVNGLLMFPRKHIAPEIMLVITPQVEPEFMFGTTIHHWKLKESEKQAFFKISREYDKEAESYFWNTTQVSAPESNILPLESLLIFARPKDVFVPTGITETNGSENLTLPMIYIKKGAGVLDNAFFVLQISSFLRPIEIIYKPEAKRYQDQLIGG